MYKNSSLYLVGLLLVTNGAIASVSGSNNEQQQQNNQLRRTTTFNHRELRELNLFDSVVCGFFGNCNDNSSSNGEDTSNPDKKNETDKNDTNVIDNFFGDGGVIDQIFGGNNNNNTTKKNETDGSNILDSVFDLVNDLLSGNGTTGGGNGGKWNITWGNPDDNDGKWNNTSWGNTNGSYFGNDINITDLLNGTGLDTIFGNNTTIQDWLNATFGNLFNGGSNDSKNPLGDFFNKTLGNFLNNLFGNNTTNPGDWFNATTLLGNGTDGIFSGILGNLSNLLGGDGNSNLGFFQGLLGGDAIRNASTVSQFVGDWFDDANFVPDKVCPNRDPSTIPNCKDIIGQDGFWVCRTLTNPFTGIESSKSICISKGQYIKGPDTCGCCESTGCPSTKKK